MERTMTPPETDSNAIAASVRDPRAFVAVFERHFREIHRYLARRVGTQLADDLAAEVFAEAFRIRSRYRPDHDDARPWLYGIAANLLGRHRRTEGRRLRALAAAHGQRPAVAGADVAFERAAAAALAPRLAAALRTLAPRDREVLLLVAWAELSYAEVATALEIPVGTVRSRLNRGRARIARALDDDDPAPAPQGAFNA
jgi:RNA polymerase sigma-70 factor (ECF subfamily)